MKNLTFGAAMALSVVASTAQAQNTAPTMMMDEMVVKNQTIAHVSFVIDKYFR